MPDRCHAERYRREMEGHYPVAIAGWADETERTAEEYSRDHGANAPPSPAGNDRCRDPRTSAGARLALAGTVFADAVRDDPGARIGGPLHLGQRASQTGAFRLKSRRGFCVFILPR